MGEIENWKQGFIVSCPFQSVDNKRSALSLPLGVDSSSLSTDPLTGLFSERGQQTQLYGYSIILISTVSQ